MSDSSMKRYRLGDLLVLRGVITEKQLDEALKMQQKQQRWLGDCLISLGFVTDSDIADVLEVQMDIPRVQLRGLQVPVNVMSLIPAEILRKHCVLPLGFSEMDPNILILAMSNPMDMVAQDDIAIITNRLIEVRIATVSEINAVLDRFFGTDEVMSIAEQYSKVREQQLQQMAVVETVTEGEEESAPIIQLVRSVIEQAVRQRASDIHIDALEKSVRIRYRIDGVLWDKLSYEISILPAIVTRVKIIAGLDISEKRKPQDGRITMTIDKMEYDIRVAVLPSSFGEKIVLRLASNTGFSKPKSELGMDDHELERFDHILQNPNGIILVTGPTGSGKTTTLYTALSELNTEHVNIITIEDPVEANITGINQVSVNPKVDLTFANALRSILRQDPDIIMVGEIRDQETATIAVQASITGHLVVSTLHTNSSAATVTRLLEMGVESYLLADSLVGILAQRLVRRLCKECKVSRLATEIEKEILQAPLDQDLTIYEPVGCPHCNNMGYFGRIGIYEIMEITPEIKRAITSSGTTEQIKNVAIKDGMRTLRVSASNCVKEGITTIEEMKKVSFES